MSAALPDHVHDHSHVNYTSQQSYVIGTLTIFISQMSELRLRKVFFCPRSHGQQESEQERPDPLPAHPPAPPPTTTRASAVTLLTALLLAATLETGLPLLAHRVQAFPPTESQRFPGLSS